MSKIQPIPEPKEEVGALFRSVQAIKNVISLLGRNEAGHAASQVFALAGYGGKSTGVASKTDAGVSATAQVSLSSSSRMLVIYQYYGTVAGAAGTLQLYLDGNLAASVPLPVVGGQVYPQIGVALLADVGAGPHSLMAKTNAGLAGCAVAVLAFGN